MLSELRITNGFKISRLFSRTPIWAPSHHFAILYWSAARPMATTEAPSRRYYVKDHLGSVRAVVDATGAVQETRDDDPVRAAHGPQRDDGYERDRSKA